MKKNNIKTIQDILIMQIENISKLKCSDEEAKMEILKNNSIIGNATAFTKTANLGLNAIKTAKKYNLDIEYLEEKLGITDK